MQPDRIIGLRISSLCWFCMFISIPMLTVTQAVMLVSPGCRKSDGISDSKGKDYTEEGKPHLTA